MTKTQEITEKIKAGASPVDLIKKGYSRGLVYKVNKALQAKPPGNDRGGLHGETPPTGASDTNIETDPEIMQLKKELRKAELQQKLAEINAPTNLESRVAALEEKTAEMNGELGNLFEESIDIRSFINATPLSGLFKPFECACGAKGEYAIMLKCTKCGANHDCRKLPL